MTGVLKDELNDVMNKTKNDKVTILRYLIFIFDGERVQR